MTHHSGSAAACRNQLEAMLARAAEEGARRALSDVGLGGKDAVLTIHDMRSLLECISFVRRTAVQTAVHVITTGVLIALLTGIAMKLGGSARTRDQAPLLRRRFAPGGGGATRCRGKPVSSALGTPPNSSAPLLGSLGSAPTFMGRPICRAGAAISG